MKVNCLVFIAISFDGFIAKVNGDIEWLNNPKYSKSEVKGINFEKFISNIDSIVMGRNTYEKVLTFGFWPYEKEVIVLTTKNIEIPKELKNKVKVKNLSPIDLVYKLSKEGKKNLYIDGGKTIQSFIDNKLIDEMIITQVPILLGKGIRLFSESDNEYHLDLIDSEKSDNGFVQSRYKIIYK